MAVMTDTPAEELTQEEAEHLLDEQAQRYLGMSGEEFQRAWKAGEFDAVDRPKVLRVAMLLPLVSSDA